MPHLLATILSLALLTAWPGLAAAHAKLHHSQPDAGAVVATAPAKVQLWFNKAIEPAFSKVQVVDRSGKPVDQGNAAVSADDPMLLEVALPALPPGTYQVIWKIVALDGHKAKGEYRFTVKPN